MQVKGNERVVKHVGDLETCMNGDVTRNFHMKGGFCGDADGLYKVVPGQSFVKLEFDFTQNENENGLKSFTIKKLFETMCENECDYLVVIGKESTETFHAGEVLSERLDDMNKKKVKMSKNLIF